MARKKRKRRDDPMSASGKGAKCHYCERTLESTRSMSKVAATRDHLHPKSRGGEMRVWCCRQCNSLKADMSLAEWKFFMRRNPEWWTRPEFQRGTITKRTYPTPSYESDGPREGGVPWHLKYIREQRA